MAWICDEHLVASVIIFHLQLENSWNCKVLFSSRFGITSFFVERPAGGSFTVEIASNRAKSTLSYGNRDTSDWPDGGHYPEDYVHIFLTSFRDLYKFIIWAIACADLHYFAQ